MRDLSNYIKEYPQAFSADLCDTVINRFDSDDRKYPAALMGDADIKKSTDLFISVWEDWKDIDDHFYEMISKYFEDYYQFLNEDIGYGLPPVFFDKGYHIQRTCVGESYDWHTDSTIVGRLMNIKDHLYEYSDRIATFILYLNDDFEGGHTQFFNDESCDIIPEKGKLIFFPSNRLYVHKGNIVSKGTKYIMTGWMYGNFLCNDH